MQRRTWLGIASAAMLTACGFELRRPPELQLHSVQLKGFAPRSPLAEELKQQLQASGSTRVVESAAQAEAILESLIEAREQVVVASTAAGQVRELTLRLRFKFRLATPGGNELIAPTELLLSNDLSYIETSALAKEQEAEMLYRAMQSDIVSQVMRRLAAVRI
ncbi:MAG TPA: LPS assembly lipoprotein LptE [Methylibium sp.]